MIAVASQTWGRNFLDGGLHKRSIERAAHILDLIGERWPAEEKTESRFPAPTLRGT